MDQVKTDAVEEGSAREFGSAVEKGSAREFEDFMDGKSIEAERQPSMGHCQDSVNQLEVKEEEHYNPDRQLPIGVFMVEELDNPSVRECLDSRSWANIDTEEPLGKAPQGSPVLMKTEEWEGPSAQLCPVPIHPVKVEAVDGLSARDSQEPGSQVKIEGGEKTSGAKPQHLQKWDQLEDTRPFSTGNGYKQRYKRRHTEDGMPALQVKALTRMGKDKLLQHSLKRERWTMGKSRRMAPGEFRKRKAKFTDDELNIIVDGIIENYARLFGVSACRTPLSIKSGIWRDILKKLNAVSPVVRSIREIKKRWHDLRRRVRERYLEHSKATGPPKPLILSKVQEKVYSTMDMASLEGGPGADTCLSKSQGIVDVREKTLPPETQPLQQTEDEFYYEEEFDKQQNPNVDLFCPDDAQILNFQHLPENEAISETSDTAQTLAEENVAAPNSTSEMLHVQKEVLLQTSQQSRQLKRLNVKVQRLNTNMCNSSEKLHGLMKGGARSISALSRYHGAVVKLLRTNQEENRKLFESTVNCVKSLAESINNHNLTLGLLLNNVVNSSTKSQSQECECRKDIQRGGGAAPTTDAQAASSTNSVPFTRRRTRRIGCAKKRTFLVENNLQTNSNSDV
ncbi:uncharacterized protein [Ambystoma mexicanum]|uniref:uncharacterized protein isoform X2 n=1 Tax=Ambystoma mexicanum TaxID=8296 RepID=UPI0037E75C5E